MTSDQQNPFDPLTDAELAAAEVVGDEDTQDSAELVAPIPSDAPAPPAATPAAMWTYHDANGDTLFHVMRFESPDKPKQILPLTLWRDASGSNGVKWRWKAFPPPRPLYGLHLIAIRLEASVIVCEGEKAADAAQSLFPDFVATTPPGGAKATSKVDWAPLANCVVVIWPDNDETGALMRSMSPRFSRAEAQPSASLMLRSWLKLMAGSAAPIGKAGVGMPPMRLRSGLTPIRCGRWR